MRMARIIAIVGGLSRANAEGTTASGQELLGDGAAEAVVIVDEFVDEFVQALLEDLLHAAVLQPGADGAGLALRRPLPAISAGDPVEILHQVVVAARQ